MWRIPILCEIAAIAFLLLGWTHGSASNGWTTFNTTAGSGSCSTGSFTGSCIIYVSSSIGNDTTCAPQPPPVTQTPTAANVCATINKGTSLVRNGDPDWVLLKSGDTWTNDFFNKSFSGPGMVVSPAWSTAGDHAVSGVILLGYYGTGARPLIQASVAASSGQYLNITGAGRLSNVAFNGWEFYAFTRDPNNGGFISGDATASMGMINMFVTGSNLIFEDNKVSFFSGSLSYTGTPYGTQFNGLIFRRNVIVDQYQGNSRSQGMFLEGILNGIIEENTFDHNGWNANVASAPQRNDNHNVYISIPGCGPFIIRGNIFANDPGGEQFRTGGTVYNNLFVHNSANVIVSVNTTTMNYNVIQEASDITGTNATVQALGYELAYGANSVLDHNIISLENSVGGNEFGFNIHGPATVTGNFNGTTTVTNVSNGGIGSGNGVGLEGWPVGLPITGSLIPANTTVVSASGFDDTGAVGSIVMSNAASGSGTGVTINQIVLNATISNSAIFNQRGGIIDSGTGTTLTNNCNDPNALNNVCGATSPAEPYPSPSRSVETYDTSLGGPGTLTHFLSLARAQTKANWNTAYMANGVNNYVRTGFNFPLQ